MPSPSRDGTRAPRRARRGDRGGAARPRLPLRARLSRARRLSAPAPAARSRRPTLACRSRRLSVRSGDARPAGLVHPGPRAASPAPAWCSSTAGSRRATGRCRMALFLHAAGFHCLTIDVRGHGANPAGGAADQRRRVRARCARGVRGARRPPGRHGRRHRRSLDGRDRGDPRRRRRPARRRGRRDLGPADPYRLTRQTFRLAHLPIPDPIAYPLAWLTTRVYLRPARTRRRRDQRDRGHRALSRPDPARPRRRRRRRAARAPASGWQPAARRSRAGDPDAAPVETFVIAGGQHSWLYEYRGLSARRSRGSSRPRSAVRCTPYEAAALAAATPPSASPTAESRFSAVDGHPGWLPDARPGRPARRDRRPHRARRGARRRRRRARARLTGTTSSGTRSHAKRAIRRFADRPLERRAPRADPRMRAAAPTARRTSSAGRSSSVADRRPPARTGRRSGPRRGTWPEPPRRSPS